MNIHEGKHKNGSHIMKCALPEKKVLFAAISLLRPFLCFTTNQFALKFKFLANFEYFVNICNIH